MNAISTNSRTLWQVSLRRLLVVVGLFSCGLGLLGRQVLLRERYLGLGGEVIDMRGLWKVQMGSPEMMHMVVYPKDVHGHYMVATMRGHTPGKRGVSLLPEGVYLDGIRMESDCRVFLMSSERQLIPIELSPQELKSLTPDTAKDISQTAAWPKIKDIYEAEGKAMVKNFKLPQWQN